MRAAVVVLLLAVAGLVVSTAARLRAGPGRLELARAQAALQQFEATHRPLADVNLATLYAGRIELLDPALALPTWHRHDVEAAVAVSRAGSRCPAPAVAVVADASLAKAYRWHAAACEGGLADEEAALSTPPFMHPAGSSYAALALARSPRNKAWIQGHLRAFHVNELASLEPSMLAADDRALGSLPAETWASLGRGDGLDLTDRSLVVAEHGALGLARLRVYAARDWAEFARRSSIALVPRREAEVCAQPASGTLCWQPLSFAEHHRRALVASTLGSAMTAVGAAIAMVVAQVHQRRRAHLDRVHVLRTLTHELRTPATSLGLDIEPLRAAYDDLPEACQEPVLRLSDSIERLQRELHRTARYMALFETPGGPPGRLVEWTSYPSTAELFAELAEEWPESVRLAAASPDGPVTTDATWLGLAIRNLVGNGVRHGVAPVSVTWALERGDLVVRVADLGTTRELALHRVVMPFVRSSQSTGLGLGLALVDRVARLLGGRLTHRPSPTEFTVRVPGQRRS